MQIGFQVHNKHLMQLPGELFLGKPFGALDQNHPPAYAHDLDNFFVVYGLQCAFPALTKLVRWLGPSKIRRWLYTCDRMYKIYQSISEVSINMANQMVV
jgi:benzoate 4-monooxygenase